jgi:hypothetical protein
VQQNREALKFASNKLKKGNQFISAAVQQNGAALQCVSTELKKDKDVVLTAVQQIGGALQYALPKLETEIERSNLIAFTAPSNENKKEETGKSTSTSRLLPRQKGRTL